MKLLATDMDGTFLRDDKSYSEEFNDLYKQMLKQDIQFVIASGNQYEALACKFDEEINDILESLHKLVDSNEDTKFDKLVHLIETFKGAGFLSAATIMGEIGDFSAFSKPKPVSYTHLTLPTIA